MNAEIFNLLIPGQFIFGLSSLFILLSVLILNPFIGLIAYLSCITLNPQTFSYFLVQIHITRVVAFIAIGLTLIKLTKEDFKRAFEIIQSKILLILLLFIFVALFCGIGWRVTVLEVFEQMGKNIVLYFLVILLVTNRSRLRGVVWIWLVFLGILAVNTIHAFNFFGPEAAEAMRFGGYDSSYFGGAGDFAVMMNVAFALAFFMFFAERNIIFKAFFLSLALLFVAAIVSSFARGAGIISFLATCLVIFILGLGSKSWFQKILCLILPILLIVGLFAYSPDNFIERMNTIKDFRGGTGGLRIEYWKIGLAMFKHNPILGVGPGNYPLQYHNYGGWEHTMRVPHNMFIDAISEMGIVGITCLFLLLFISYRNTRTSKKLMEERNEMKEISYFISQGLFCALAAYCIGGMFQSIFWYPFLYLIIGLIVANYNIIAKEGCTKKVKA